MSFPISPVDREVYKNYMWDAASGAWLKIDAEPVGSLRSRSEPPGVTLPQLPDAWQRADGQMISDAASPFNGKRIYNYNGANVELSLTWTWLAGSISRATVPLADRLAIGIGDDVIGSGWFDNTVVLSMNYETGVVEISTMVSGTAPTTFTNEGRGAVGGDFGSVGNQMQRITGSFDLPRRGSNAGASLLLSQSGAVTRSESSGATSINPLALATLSHSGDRVNFDSANSPNARTSATTNGRTKTDAYKAVYYVRIK